MAWQDWWRDNVPGARAIGDWLTSRPGDEYASQLQGYARMVQERDAPRAAYSAYRPMQLDLAKRLEAQSRGEGPSLAAQQLQAATDRSQRQAQGLAAGASGPNAALAQFQAQNAGAAMGTQAAQDAAAARIQEQYNAQNLLGLTLHGGRQADEQVNMANQDAMLRMYGLTDDAVLRALGGAGQLSGGPQMWERLAGGVANVMGVAGAQRGMGGGGGGAPAPTFHGNGSPGAGGGWY